MRNPSPNPFPTIRERATYALNNRDVQHSPDDMREIIAGLLAELAAPPRIADGWGVFAMYAPNTYCLQSVIRLTRSEAELDASRFIPGCDAHVRPLYAGGRS